MNLERYAKVKRAGRKWKACLVVGNQEFTVVEDTTRARAQWFSEMLVKALKKLVDDERKLK